MVEDSLFALSKRIIQLEPIVNREIGLVNHHMKLAIDDVGERRTESVRMNQQYVMTSFNNLALLLDEALQAMQEQQMEQKSKDPGSGSCNKPGGQGKKPSAKPGDLKKMQEALSKQLQQMKDQMGKDGNKGKNNSGGGEMSKQLAEMAAKQAAIRKMMEELSQELNKDGSGAGNEIKEITKEMEKLEEDIVNKRIDQQTIDRQQDILIRLLKAENAERTREEDERRQSRTGDQGLRSTPPGLEDYLKQKERETELLRTIPPSLKPYYKERVNDYFNTLER
jgi:chromosome segregation ATPase